MVPNPAFERGLNQPRRLQPTPDTFHQPVSIEHPAKNIHCPNGIFCLPVLASVVDSEPGSYVVRSSRTSGNP